MKVSVSESGMKFLKNFHEEQKLAKDIEASIEKEEADAYNWDQVQSRRSGLGSVFVNSPLIRKDRFSKAENQKTVRDSIYSPSSSQVLPQISEVDSLYLKNLRMQRQAKIQSNIGQ